MKRNSLGLRILLSIAVIIILTIPLFMIQSLISERQSYRETAVEEINKSWARSQVVAGPILTIRNESWLENQEGKKYLNVNSYHLLPESLTYETELLPETRYRGIYEVTLYKAKIKISGSFDLSKMLKITNQNLLTNIVDTYLSFNISDLKGIQGEVQIKLNDKKQEVNPGVKNQEIFNSGFISNVELDKGNTNYKFELEIILKGSENIEFIPIGKITNLKIKSIWNNPSFIGDFLPEHREITQTGFNAEWSVNYFNRDYPQEWINKNYDVFSSKFGVKLLVPVDEYQKTMRTSKYGILLIVLTFVGFFMIELFSKKIIHPIQYLLVGLSLVIFYSILLSISEYILFQYSYIISGGLIVALISFYTSNIYSNKSLGSLIGGFLIFLYGFMYVILQLQDYSLLIGNLALFIILVAIMYSTRKLNWYEIFNNNQ